MPVESYVQNKFYLDDSGGVNRCLKPQVGFHIWKNLRFFLAASESLGDGFKHFLFSSLPGEGFHLD